MIDGFAIELQGHPQIPETQFLRLAPIATTHIRQEPSSVLLKNDRTDA